MSDIITSQQTADGRRVETYLDAKFAMIELRVPDGRRFMIKLKLNEARRIARDLIARLGEVAA